MNVMNVREKGIDNLTKVVEHYAKEYPKNETIILVSYGFGETLSMSIVIRHLRKLMPTATLLWGMDRSYYEDWDIFTTQETVVVFPLPSGATQDDLAAWCAHAKTLEIADVQFPCLKARRPGLSIIQDTILNVGIQKLLIPPIPKFPHDIADYQWHDSLMFGNNFAGKPYVAIEYNPAHREKLEAIRNAMVMNKVWIGPKGDLEVTLDARGCTWRQAKVIVERAKVLLTCSEDYKVLSAVEGITTKIVDIGSDPVHQIVGRINSL